MDEANFNLNKIEYNAVFMASRMIDSTNWLLSYLLAKLDNWFIIVPLLDLTLKSLIN